MFKNRKQADRPRKIFQIGFNKTATRSLHWFFMDNNIPSIHWDGGRLARAMMYRIERGEDPCADYPDITVFTDMIALDEERNILIEVYKEFEALHRWYPDALFILNTRHVEDWIKSRMRHKKGDFLRRYMKIHNLPNADAAAGAWRRDWYSHHARILHFFKDKPENFMIFDIDRDKADKLIAFLGPDFDIVKPELRVIR